MPSSHLKFSCLCRVKSSKYSSNRPLHHTLHLCTVLVARTALDDPREGTAVDLAPSLQALGLVGSGSGVHESRLACRARSSSLFTFSFSISSRCFCPQSAFDLNHQGGEMTNLAKCHRQPDPVFVLLSYLNTRRSVGCGLTEETSRVLQTM
jgi:hypothetical protein